MKNNKKKLFLKIIIVLFLLFTLGALEYYGIIWHTKIFTIGYKIEGIDISHHQGKIDWKKVKDENKYKFVYIKATEGNDFVDNRFRENWKEARKYNFLVGAYHFFSMRSNGLEQAKSFIKLVDFEINSLPPVIDLEIASTHSPKKVEENLLLMSNELEKYYGKKPILYVTYDSYNLYIKNSKLKNKIWFRDILKRPNIGNKKWFFWQYSNRGHINGINGYVDKNVFYSNNDELLKLSKITDEGINKISKYSIEEYGINPPLGFTDLFKKYDKFNKILSIKSDNYTFLNKIILILPLSDRNTNNEKLRKKSYDLTEKIGLKFMRKTCDIKKISLIKKENSIKKLLEFKNVCSNAGLFHSMYFLEFFLKKDYNKAILFKKIEIASSKGKINENFIMLPIFFLYNGNFEKAFNNFLEMNDYFNKNKNNDSVLLKALLNTKIFNNNINIEKELIYINEILENSKKNNKFLIKAVRSLNLYYLNYYLNKYRKDTGNKFISIKEFKNKGYINFIPKDYENDIIYKYSEDYGIYIPRNKYSLN